MVAFKKSEQRKRDIMGFVFEYRKAASLVACAAFACALFAGAGAAAAAPSDTPSTVRDVWGDGDTSF